MKFSGFREFKPPYLRLVDAVEKRLEDVTSYLQVDLVKSFKELTVGLTDLSFEDNFNGWIAEDVEIAAGAEEAITNELDGGEIPTKRLVVKGGDGSQNIVDGDTDWDENFVYVKNVGSSSVTVDILFLK